MEVDNLRSSMKKNDLNKFSVLLSFRTLQSLSKKCHKTTSVLQGSSHVFGLVHIISFKKQLLISDKNKSD